MIIRVLSRLESFAGLVVLAIMGVTVVDVAGRYAFNRPLPGSFEITQLLLVLVIFAGLPGVCSAGTHIRVDILTNAMRGRARDILERACAALMIATLGFLAVLMWGKAGEVIAIGDVTPYLHIPIGPFAYFISIACAISALALAAATIRSGRAGADGSAP